MKLQRFDGGMSARLAPHLIQQNEAIQYQNIDNSKGTLVSAIGLSTASELADADYLWWSAALGKWMFSGTFTTYVELDDVVYSANGSTRPHKESATLDTNLGLAAPVNVDFEGSTTDTVGIATLGIHRVTTTSPAALRLATTYYLIGELDGSKFSQMKLVTAPVNRLESITTVLFTGETLPTFDETYELSTGRQEITIFNRSDVEAHVFRLYKGQWRRALVLAPNTVGYDNVYAIDANPLLNADSLGKVYSPVQYVVTAYNSVTGLESGPSLPTPEIDPLMAGAVELYNIPPVPAGEDADQIRLYRIGNGLDEFVLIDYFEADGIPSLYQDYAGISGLTDKLLVNEDSLPPPDSLTNLVTSNGMLLGSSGTDLKFTPIGEPDSWPALYFIRFESDIKAVAVVYHGILVMTESKTFIVTGSGPESFVKSLVSADQGAVNQNSVQVMRGAAIWLSSSGICMSNGSDVQVISRDKLGKLSLNPSTSAVSNEVYYLALGVDGDMLALDLGFGGIYKSFTGYGEYIANKNSVLYVNDNGNIRSAFTNGPLKSFYYSSPVFIEGSFTEEKLYKKVYIYCKSGIIEIGIFINGTDVATRQLTQGLNVIQVPQSYQRGHYIQFVVEGIGEVAEIEYEVGRQTADGR